jgi:hypothetical protein
MPATTEKRHGIPLLKRRFPAPHKVGVRYWSLDDDGALGAPLYASVPWDAGLNRGLTSGLFCFHYEEGLDQTPYFHLSNATYGGTQRSEYVIGGIAYWVPAAEQSAGGIVNAKYAAVACLTMPAYADADHRARIECAADRYGVEIVEHTAIKSAVDDYVENRLPGFYDPPLAPLSSLIGSAVTEPGDRFHFAPRTHRERVSA